MAIIYQYHWIDLPNFNWDECKAFVNSQCIVRFGGCMQPSFQYSKVRHFIFTAIFIFIIYWHEICPFFWTIFSRHIRISQNLCHSMHTVLRFWHFITVFHSLFKCMGAFQRSRKSFRWKCHFVKEFACRILLLHSCLTTIVSGSHFIIRHSGQAIRSAIISKRWSGLQRQ